MIVLIEALLFFRRTECVFESSQVAGFTTRSEIFFSEDKVGSNDRLAILGAGNIGASIAKGLIHTNRFSPEQITLTRRRLHLLDDFKALGVIVHATNPEAVRNSRTIIIAVEPKRINELLKEIDAELQAERHVLISVVSGVSIKQIRDHISHEVAIVRAMPNTAIAIGESMTCLASNQKNSEALDIARSIFDTVGKTKILEEEQFTAATALGACGVAFFLRAIRAAGQGGIQIGFHAEDALEIAAQTAKGAASLVLQMGNHPESEIDKVTTPEGCTIVGLNQLEHEGFNSAMIKAIVCSADKAKELYSGDQKRK
jgi:pyrroline-5-carboxylate reductase